MGWFEQQQQQQNFAYHYVRTELYMKPNYTAVFS